MIRIKNISFHYQASSIFEAFSWEARQAESWAVLGPSGCGKSTLLALLAGLIHPASGNISIYSEPILRPRPRTGLILQEYGLLPWATVRENIRLGLDIRKFYGGDGIHAPHGSVLTADVDYWLERLGLAPVAGKFPAQISGGQRQRTAIARSLVLEPDLLLMDEPFSSLDLPTREDLRSLTAQLVREQGLTLVIVTHSTEEAVILGEKILLLSTPPNRFAAILEPPTGPGRQAGTPEFNAFCAVLRSRLAGGVAA